jgi:hypothetical protein
VILVASSFLRGDRYAHNKKGLRTIGIAANRPQPFALDRLSYVLDLPLESLSHRQKRDITPQHLRVTVIVPSRQVVEDPSSLSCFLLGSVFSMRTIAHRKTKHKGISNSLHVLLCGFQQTLAAIVSTTATNEHFVLTAHAACISLVPVPTML